MCLAVQRLFEGRDAPGLQTFRCNKARTGRALLVLRIWWSRGNLNPLSKIMIYIANICFYFWLEYHLEYRAKLYFT